jgi:oligopeptidase A
LKLKLEKAKILGYKNYAEYSLQSKMASSPEEVINLIE